MTIRFLVAVLAGKFTRFLLRLLGREAGTWPGEIALRIDPKILTQFSQSTPNSILIAGTNGKTTTAKMIETILRGNGKSVFHNESGANLDNGLVSSFLTASDWGGKIQSDYCIFEVDEATLPVVLKQMSPKIIVLLNLFRDQLDRYGEVDAIAEKWLEALKSLRDVSFLINADDPQLAFIGSRLSVPVQYFGLEDPSLFVQKSQHASDSLYCPSCGGRLTFVGVYFAHLGKWSCGNCGFTHPAVSLSTKSVTSPIAGVYNQYNTIAAALVCTCLGITLQHIQEALFNFKPAFGRQETIEFDGKKIKILLSKNPVGFNESLRTAISEGAKCILLVLNDRIPDGRDVSWIWDVDFEMLSKDIQIVVSGDRAYDLALRLKYADKQFQLYTKIGEALEKIDMTETLWVLPTYSAMLEVREQLTGKRIL